MDFLLSSFYVLKQFLNKCGQCFVYNVSQSTKMVLMTKESKDWRNSINKQEDVLLGMIGKLVLKLT